MDYVNRTIYLQNFAKEIRLSSIYTVLKCIYEEGFSGLMKVYKGIASRPLSNAFCVMSLPFCSFSRVSSSMVHTVRSYQKVFL
jgi:hypothetical protein